MGVMTKNSKLRKGLAAFGAAAMLAGAIGPVAAIAELSVESSTVTNKYSSTEAPITSDTDVILTVSDVRSDSDTISVTAPLKIYLAADTKDIGSTDKIASFIAPSKEAVRITNNSLGSQVKLAGFTVSDNEGVVKGLAKKTTDETGFYASTATEFKKDASLTVDGKKDNSYWLQAAISNQGQEATLELGVDSGTFDDDTKTALTMNANNTVGDGIYSSLLLDLSGEIYNPLHDSAAFGEPNGARLSTITWTFEKV